MTISELIKQLSILKIQHGDLLVCMRDHSEEYGFPFMEIESVDFMLRDVTNEDEEEPPEEILKFIGLDYM